VSAGTAVVVVTAAAWALHRFRESVDPSALILEQTIVLPVVSLTAVAPGVEQNSPSWKAQAGVLTERTPTTTARPANSLRIRIPPPESM